MVDDFDFAAEPNADCRAQIQVDHPNQSWEDAYCPCVRRL
jgi:hypothetical protein